MLNFCKKGVVLIYAFILALVAIDVFICQTFIKQFGKKDFALPNIVLFLIGLAALSVLSYLVIRYYGAIVPRLETVISRKGIIIASVILFFAQLYVLRNIYFLTGWDAEVILDSAGALLRGEHVAEWYYSPYPNNLFLTCVFAFILKINAALGIYPENVGVFALIAVQCVIFFVVAYLVYSVCYDFTKNKSASAMAYAVYLIFIGFSPWAVIPYSDAMGLIFPILTVRLYQLIRSTVGRAPRIILWGIMGLVALIGFKVKPQLAIAFIAVVLLEIVRIVSMLIKDRGQLAGAVINLAVCFAVFITAALGLSVMLKGESDMLDKESEIGITHFFMMGLNDETDGIYSDEDVDFSKSFETKGERSEANIKEAFRRISELGFFGTVRHITEKTLVNFGDGTFAWGVEGNFFKTVLPEPNDTVSGALRSYYYADGDNYGIFITIMQLIWLVVLILSGAACIYALKRKDEGGETMTVLLLSLIGLTLFETLFEARARYLFTYAPIFVICACVGLYSILKMIIKKTKEREKTDEA